jgi:hypothetical protein
MFSASVLKFDASENSSRNPDFRSDGILVLKGIYVGVITAVTTESLRDDGYCSLKLINYDRTPSRRFEIVDENLGGLGTSTGAGKRPELGSLLGKSRKRDCCG